jgi:hypothetical protein
MAMSYDFDFMLADYNEDILEILKNGINYTYSLSSRSDLFEGGKANGVDYEVIGHPEDTEDTEEWEDWGDWNVDFTDRDEW